jgi:hypothetical protein
MAAVSSGLRPATVARRALAVLLTAAAFAWLFSRAPFVRRPQTVAARGTTESAPRLPGGAAPSSFSLNGLQVRSEVLPVAACDPADWSPAAAGMCGGDPGCRLVVERRTPLEGRFGWLQRQGDRLTMHSAVLRCASPRGHGRLLHESLAVDRGLMTAFAGRRRAGAGAAPIDFASGSWHVSTFGTESAETSVEAKELALMQDGWRPLAVPASHDSTSHGVRILIKGGEVCLLSVVDAESQPLAVAACQNGRTGVMP